MKTAWDKVRLHYPFLVECKLVLEFLRRDENLFASALIPLSTIIQAKNAFAIDCRNIPKQRQFASAVLAELENPPQNQGGYTASVQQQQWSPTTQPNYGTYGVSYRDIQSYNMQRPSRQIPPQPPPPPPMGRGEGRSAGNPNCGFHIPPWNRGGGVGRTAP